MYKYRQRLGGCAPRPPARMCPTASAPLLKKSSYASDITAVAFKFSFFVRFQILNKDLTESFHAIATAH